MRNLFLSIVMLLGWTAFAQTNAPKVGDIQWSIGPQFSTANETGDIESYRKLFELSPYLPQDLSLYQQNSFFTFNGSGSFNAAINLFPWSAASQKHSDLRSFRIGVSFMGSHTAGGSLFRSESTTIDTLESSSGMKYLVDSVYTHYLNFSAQSQNLFLDIAYLFRTSTNARWSLFAGVGVQTGLSFNRKATMYSWEQRHLEINGSETRINEGEFTRPDLEMRQLKAGWSSNVYLPMGIDCKLGTKKPFWKPLHLFYELRPSLLMT
ncbi:MAG: hypothetical protein LPK45_03675, partial [Bacteroidota bacterium]|nr:hypothetical protein [Bacteroidota bacterium]MDX5430151.1 hypothetical protein [Bacteroidota bacterium]MDX5468912.1 hypothetical protein [Bacteroidota bacterium]